MIHVCLVGIEYPPDTDFGGISTYQKSLADTLISLGHKVTVICGSEENSKDYYENNIHVIRLFTSRIKENTKSFNDYRHLVKSTILKINEQEKIDIIETPEFSGEIVEFLKNRNIPVVVKLHTSYKIWSKFNNSQINRELNNQIIKVENLIMMYADKLICCSQILKDLLPIYHNKININNIEVVPNPANIDSFYPIKNNHNSKTILYCGNFEKRKGIFNLAKAIPLIFNEIKDKELKFQIIGNYFEETKRKFLEKIPKKYHKHIEFLGYIENKELNKYYNNARIGVIPSLFDNLPYVAMEELLTELPIVASQNTGIKEMIENEKSGILYDPNDYVALANGVVKLYKNTELAKICGKNGRKEILNKYSPETIAKKTIRIYEQVIKNYNFNRKKLHVCLTNFEYPNETSLGGIAIYQKRMADALNNMGCKVTVICGSFKNYRDYYEDGIHIYRIPKKFPYKNTNDYYSYRHKLNNIIKEINEFDKIDIIESPEISAELITFIKQKNIPVVTKLHTSYTIIKKLNNESMFPSTIENIIFNNENNILKKSDKLICCSQILKELLPIYHDKININNIEVVPNPANIDSFYPIKNNHNSKTILYCGNFTIRKGIFQFAKSIPLIFNEIKDKELKFQIIGSYDGPEQSGKSLREKFLEKIPKKYHKHIEFLGYIENKELNKYYNNARIGVIPSLFDNLPYVAMEELLTELPIVASQNTGIKEMIENEKSGILYDPNDYVALANGVVKLYKNTELAKICGKNGRKEILNKYSPETIAKKTIRIYEQVIRDYNNKNILKNVCEKYNIQILNNFRYGGANIVKKCLYNNQKCVLKIYHSSKQYNLNLINKLLDKLDNVNKVIFHDKYLDYEVYLYSYLIGKHTKKYSNSKLLNLFHFINKLKSIDLFDNMKNQQNILKKYNKYKNYFTSYPISFNKYIIKELLMYDKKYVNNLSEENSCLIHGDLSPKNIIWQKDTPFIIDFDECCFAQQEYEYMSFLIKSCFYDNFFDIEFALKIINLIKTQNVNINTLKSNYYFYILKVLFEKIYYHEVLGLDLDSVNQRKDHWTWWYNLLTNKAITKILFNNDDISYNIIKTLKDVNNSKVLYVEKNSEKYILKIVTNVNNKYHNNEQKILVNLVNYIPVSPLLSIKFNKNKVIKKYEYFPSKNIEIIDNSVIFNIKIMSDRLDSISDYINCPVGSIIEKLNDFKIKNDYINKIIIKLKNDDKFFNLIACDRIAIIHDDLNRSNILVNENGICIIDFEGLKKYPKTMQLASFITLYYLCENTNFNMTNLLKIWNEEINLNYLYKLIVFRLIKVYNYFENTSKLDKSQMKRKKLVFKRIKEWSEKI